MNNKKGFSHLIVALLVVIIFAVIFVLLRSGGLAPVEDLESMATPTPTVSLSDDMETLETEIEATVISDIEEDITNLESSLDEL